MPPRWPPPLPRATRPRRPCRGGDGTRRSVPHVCARRRRARALGEPARRCLGCRHHGGRCPRRATSCCWRSTRDGSTGASGAMRPASSLKLSARVASVPPRRHAARRRGCAGWPRPCNRRTCAPSPPPGTPDSTPVPRFPLPLAHLPPRACLPPPPTPPTTKSPPLPSRTHTTHTLTRWPPCSRRWR